MSSVESILRRVVRGEDARLRCVLDVVMMMGCAPRGISWIVVVMCDTESGEVATEGPFGVVVRDLRIAGVDRDAAFARALARSGSCISVVRSDLRDVRFGLDPTRWKRSLSLMEDGPLPSSESSQSDESSSSSIALSDTSSSSSSDSKTGLCRAAEAFAFDAWSLNEVCFLEVSPPSRNDGFLRLSDSRLLCMWLSSELSSSPDDVPIVNMAPFFLGGCCRYEGEVLRIGVGIAARFVCERYDDGAPPGTKPRTMLCVLLISVDELSCDPTL